MSNSHNHNHSHSPMDTDSKNIGIAFVLNAVFVVIELIGGIYTNSISILSDALHDFGDCISLGLSWVFQRKSHQGRDQHYSYGYKRYTLLSSVFLSALLMLSSFFMIYESIGRIINPEAVNANGMLWLAIVGVVINGSAAFRLKKGSSINSRAVYLHIMEDVLGWVAVLISSIVMLFWDIPILDSILSIGISAWVLYNVWNNLKRTFTILLQAVPKGMDLKEVEQEILTLNDIEGLHDLHVWSQDGESHVMSVHIIVGKISDEKIHTLKQDLRTLVKKWNVEHITIEMERQGEDCDYQ